ncbi:hypothetical protein [Gordonia soli]|nr:hypothetical protein [Gordonia soli]
MFTDDDFVNQPHGDKWLYMTLLGQPALNYAGVQPINMRRWRKALRDGHTLPSETDVEKALIRMEERGFVFTDDDTGEVLVRSFMRSDGIDRQPNVLKSALRALAQVESPKLAAVMLDELGRLTVPEVKSDKLGAEIDTLWAAARTHLDRRTEGFTEPFPKPFAEPFTEGLPEPFTRPGKTEPFAEPFREGLPEGSVVVEVGVNSPTADGYVESSRARGDDSRTDGRAPDSIEPSQRSSTTNDPEPPIRCKRHLSDPENTTPCGPCANFRKLHANWVERQTRRDAEAKSAEARERAQLRTAEIDACELCDDRGYVGTRVCDHDPAAAERNSRGAAQVREALAAARAATTTPDPDDAAEDDDPLTVDTEERHVV